MNYPIWKRLLDIAGAATGLLLIAPFILFIALAIKLDSRGEVFIRLLRVSEGKIVGVYKFRSMVKGAHKMKINL